MYNTNNNLIDWFLKNKRPMPWRNTSDPYKIWLSETMLQQTQVKTVIPYYNKWVTRYPTIHDVASANEDTLLKSWEGLGYYRRCRNFHKAAKIIVTKHEGTIPNDYNDFKSLPGVGDYTASAVFSIAFDKQHHVLDANVKRVMCRYLGIKTGTPRNNKRIEKILNYWVRQSESPGDFNQAMMELGSQVCTNSNPVCSICPFVKTCRASHSSNPEKYPSKIPNKKIPSYDVSVGIIWDNEKFYIQRRDKKMHLGGLWELPGGKLNSKERLEDALKREINEECSADVTVGKKAGFIKHQYSHFKINLTAFHCRLNNGSTIPVTKSSSWIVPNEIDSYPFPRATLKIFEQAMP